MIKACDKVNIVFSDGHLQEGIVREVMNTSNFQFKVETKDAFGKDTIIYCNEKDLIKL